MVGAAGDQISEESKAVCLIDAVVNPKWFHTVFCSEQEIRVDEGGAAKRRAAKAGPDVDPGYEGEPLCPVYDGSVDNLVLDLTTNSVLLFVAL